MHYTQTQRKQTMDRVFKIVKANKDRPKEKIIALIAFNLGCQLKKAEEYYYVLENLE